MISSISTQEDYDINPDDLLANNYHRGIGDDDEDDNLSIVVREAQKYNHKTKKLSQFFSKSEVDVLFRNLTHFIDEFASKFKFSKTSYGANFQTIDEKSIQVDITVNILKVPDEDIHCVQVIRNQGNALVFTKMFKKLKEVFAGHADTIYEPRDED